MRFNNVISIEVRHLASCFDPNLVLAKLGEIVKTSDIQSKFASLREFSDEDTGAQQLLLWNVGGHVRNCMVDVKNSIFNETKN
jgi:hypothetical protein